MMRFSFARRFALAFALLSFSIVLVRANSTTCLTMQDLQAMSPCELAALYARSSVGTPFSGKMEGKILHITDARFPKLRVKLSNFAWRGKTAEPDGHFVNRWVAGIEKIGSQYVIAPSWIDGQPAIVVEYPEGTKLLWNMRDEVREVAPGLYMGPIFDRFPCPKFRGYLALQSVCDCK